MINKIIRNFLAKQVAGRSDDGIMITLKDPKKVELLENIMADLLMRNGIDPRAITSEAQLKTILNQIEAASKQTTQSGIRNTQSAKVFDLEGKEIPKGSKIMGGKEVKGTSDRDRVRNEMKTKYGFTDERLNEIENTPVDEEMADRLIAETDLPKNDLVSRQIKIMNAADRIKPGLFENITEEQIDILVKYADRIDDDLLRNIVLDPDPNNRAAAVATLEQVDALMSEGKSIDEIMSILQSTPRRKQAEGGLSYLMGM